MIGCRSAVIAALAGHGDACLRLLLVSAAGLGDRRERDGRCGSRAFVPGLLQVFLQWRPGVKPRSAVRES
jgi:hypothetical protein